MENLEDMLNNIIGNVLVASGFVAYLGPFTVRGSGFCLQEAAYGQHCTYQAPPLG